MNIKTEIGYYPRSYQEDRDLMDARRDLEICRRIIRGFRSSLSSWLNMSNAEMRLHCGELSAQEIRSIRAVLNAIASEVH